MGTPAHVTRGGGTDAKGDALIITRTPLRISFFGGGTDIPAYCQHAPGAVLSATINKYVYVIVNPKFDGRIRVSYSETENVDHVDEVRHNIIREAMKLVDVTEGIEIVTVADVPGRGTGLGSSSALAVGLLNALYAYKGEGWILELLAEQACHIEIDILKKPIGRQDQYAAALGGLRFYEFNMDGYQRNVPLSYRILELIEKHLLLFRIERARESAQKRDFNEMRHAADCAWEARAALEDRDFEHFGRLLDVAWEEKKRHHIGITSPAIDDLYSCAMIAGAWGGKMCGAAGGGFLLMCCAPEKRDSVKAALSDVREVPFRLTTRGSQVIWKK